MAALLPAEGHSLLRLPLYGSPNGLKEGRPEGGEKCACVQWRLVRVENGTHAQMERGKVPCVRMRMAPVVCRGRLRGGFGPPCAHARCRMACGVAGQSSRDLAGVWGGVGPCRSRTSLSQARLRRDGRRAGVPELRRRGALWRRRAAAWASPLAPLSGGGPPRLGVGKHKCACALRAGLQQQQAGRAKRRRQRRLSSRSARPVPLTPAQPGQCPLTPDPQPPASPAQPGWCPSLLPQPGQCPLIPDPQPPASPAPPQPGWCPSLPLQPGHFPSLPDPQPPASPAGAPHSCPSLASAPSLLTRSPPQAQPQPGRCPSLLTRSPLLARPRPSLAGAPHSRPSLAGAPSFLTRSPLLARPRSSLAGARSSLAGARSSLAGARSSLARSPPQAWPAALRKPGPQPSASLARSPPQAWPAALRKPGPQPSASPAPAWPVPLISDLQPPASPAPPQPGRCPSLPTRSPLLAKPAPLWRRDLQVGQGETPARSRRGVKVEAFELVPRALAWGGSPVSCLISDPGPPALPVRGGLPPVPQLAAASPQSWRQPGALAPRGECAWVAYTWWARDARPPSPYL
ncbi:uncharacterized protein [Lepidochelys kempii]|uniref:uncharacterized protein n=1 Tax=Lepidochelys kempii TaxID=8472 RepID=UPI003C6FDDCE